MRCFTVVTVSIMKQSILCPVRVALYLSPTLLVAYVHLSAFKISVTH